MMQQTSILDTSCDFFCDSNNNEDVSFMHQEEEKGYQDHPKPSIQTMFKYAPPPDLTTPEDNELTNFDCMNNALSPHMSSYLQYLKDPASMPTLDTLEWPSIPQTQEWVDMGIMDNGAHDLPFYNDSNPLIQDNLQVPSDIWLHAPFDNCIVPPPQQDHRVSISSPLDPCLYDTITHNTSNGMTHEYVSLSDINSFVVETDSQKNTTTSMHPSYSTPENLQLLGNMDEQCQEDDESAAIYPWLGLASYASVPVSLNQLDSDTESSSTSSDPIFKAAAGLASSYNPIPKQSSSSSSTVANKRKKKAYKSRQQHRVMKRSPDSISTLLARQCITPSEDLDNDDGDYYEDDDASDQSFQLSHTSSQARSLVSRKGRNVDKACNHCKRSHLRCDNMRPCRRCVATGKVGCKDVEHKPRGRPRLNKNLAVKSRKAA